MYLSPSYRGFINAKDIKNAILKVAENLFNKMEDKIKFNLRLRGFSDKRITNNRGLIAATIDETILDVVKKQNKPIDKVTVELLDVALRMVGIQLHLTIIDKIIDLVELIEVKGEHVSIKDVCELQAIWKESDQ